MRQPQGCDASFQVFQGTLSHYCHWGVSLPWWASTWGFPAELCKDMINADHFSHWLHMSVVLKQHCSLKLRFSRDLTCYWSALFHADVGQRCENQVTSPSLQHISGASHQNSLATFSSINKVDLIQNMNKLLGKKWNGSIELVQRNPSLRLL